MSDITQPQLLRVFISSPGDVTHERALAEEVIEALNHDPLVRDKVTLQAVAWDSANTPMLANMTPQEAINQGLPRPSQCDVVVVIFWARMGTPLPPEYARPDGSRYLSGTHWEYEDALQAARNCAETPARPQVLVYRRTERIALDPADPQFMPKYEQWQSVQRFFEAFTDADGSIRQGFNSYEKPEQFQADLETHLRFILRHLLQLPDVHDPQDDAPLMRILRTAAHEWAKNGRTDAYRWPYERLRPFQSVIERHRKKLDAITREFIRPEQDRLLEELEDPDTPHLRRAIIGDRLSEIGDTREGIGLRADGLPDIVWCDVPGGEITLEGQSYPVAPFRIGKYLITYAQYKVFLEAGDGFHDPRWWGAWARKRKSEPGTQLIALPNQPATNVSWYDAVAYCLWLSEQLGYAVRLPTEAEWAFAACGGNPTLEYPWGRWDARFASTFKNGLARTMAVGMYPHGACPCGALDMGGNVWEWCISPGILPTSTDISGNTMRAVRGGSANSSPRKSAISYRANDQQSRHSQYVGFRLVTARMTR